MHKRLRFPKGFLWGVAASAYQIEGGKGEDGKGLSNWDVFTHTPGKIKYGHNADVSTDHYHRWKEDVDLLAEIGVKAYRLSTSWSRIIPAGQGKVNRKGLDFYSRLVDRLLEKGITPYVNLFHWDLPDALEKKRGWRSKETSYAFADYGTVVFQALSDRVKDWMMFNEMKCIYELSYGTGELAPGLRLPKRAQYQALHNLMLAHGLAVQALRANGKGRNRAGLINALAGVIPETDSAKDVRAAEKCWLERNALFFEPFFYGKYPEGSFGEGEEPDATADEMKIIAAPIDFVGINLYGANRVAHDSGARNGYRELQPPMISPFTTMRWPITPKLMYYGVKFTKDNYGRHAKALYITESGAAFVDVLGHDGKVHDFGRIQFLKDYLAELHRAIRQGYEVKGYFLWSFIDNFEWAMGYTHRFGLVYCDWPTLRRIPKDSAFFYRDAIKNNGFTYDARRDAYQSWLDQLNPL